MARERARIEGGAAARRRAFALASGTVALSGLGLTGETAGVTRRTRAVGAPRRTGLGSGLRAAPGEAADLEGGALAAWDWLRISGGRLRRRDGDAWAVETRLRRVEARAILVRDGAKRDLVGGVAADFGGRDADREGEGGGATATSPSTARIETGAGPRGPFARLGIEARDRRVRGAARYQWEAWRERPGTLDLEGSWSGRGAGARVRWRSWSAAGAPRSAASAAAGPPDDGLAECDLRFAGAWRLRLGSKPRQPDGSGGERFAAGEWTVGREAGRTLRFTAGWRNTQRRERWKRGRSAGALFDWSAPRDRAAMTLAVEAVRAEGGGSSLGPALEVSEGGSLRARTRSGIRVAARGWMKVGAWRVGAEADGEDDGTLEEETTTGARRATRATLWLAWSGGESAR